MEVLHKDVFEKNCNKVLIFRTLPTRDSNRLIIVDLNTVSIVEADKHGSLKLYNNEDKIIHNVQYENKEKAKEYYDKICSLLTSSKTE